MLGYVQVFKPELKIREYEIYQGYYCGICKYIGARLGQFPRLFLSYDAVFLALLLASVSDGADQPAQEHCIAHHIARRPVIRNEAVEYAGDVMLILAWHKLADDVDDEHSPKAKAAQVLLKASYRKLSGKYPDLCDQLAARIRELRELEEASCPSLDRAAEPFAKIMELIFAKGVEVLYSRPPITEEFDILHRVFSLMGYHMGKWIYLMDAADDIEENIDKGTYNPLLYRFGYRNCDGQHPDAADETPAAFRDRIRDKLEFNLYHYLSVISRQLDDFTINKNKGIIENVIYFGLNRKTEDIINNKEKNNESL